MPMLEHSPMLRSRNFEETRAFLARSHGIDMDLLDAPLGNRVDVRLNALFLPGQWVAYLQYGAAARFGLRPWSSPWLGKEVYWVHFSLRGRIQAVIGDQTFEGDEEH